jgi:hypothetical protein
LGFFHKMPTDSLPMPSDVKGKPSAELPAPPSTVIEPPSVKLIVRLFLIPLLIVAVAMGIMFLIGRMAGGEPTLDEALARLKHRGGERTADFLVGPASKQRYIDAKTIVDKMKSGMSEGERITLTKELIDILDNYTSNDEGDIRHFVLLALGRTWQKDPNEAALDSSQAIESRQAAIAEILRYADDKDVTTRKAALLASVYLAGRDEAKNAIPKLLEKLNDPLEDLDVRMAAATAIGPIAAAVDPNEKDVLAALNSAMRDTEPKDVELVWDSALSLAQLNQPDATDTVLGLLNREQLAKIQYYDRETDPKNPAFRTLGEAEIQRILINAMIGAQHLSVPSVRERIEKITADDPSPRVREAGQEVLQQMKLVKPQG